MAVAVGTQYQQLCDAVKNYYGAGSDQWLEIAQYGVAADNFTSIVSQVPGVNVQYAKDGSVLGYSMSEQAGFSSGGPSVSEWLNSNTQSGTAAQANTASINIPASTGIASGGTNATAQGGVSRVYQAGQAVTSGVKFVTGEVLPAVLAAGTGITLGKTIDSALYNANPDFWDSVGLSTLNPETWNSITTDYDGPTVLKSAFNTIFGLDPESGKMQMYASEDALSYLALYMAQNGFFGQSGEYDAPTTTIDGTTIDAFSFGLAKKAQFGSQDLVPFAVFAPSDKVVNPSGTDDLRVIADSNCAVVSASDIQTSNYSHSYTYDNKTVYCRYYIPVTTNTIITHGQNLPINAPRRFQEGEELRMGWIMVYGNIPSGGSVPGVGDQPGATTPTGSDSWTTPANTKTSLQSQYPELWDNRIEQDVLQPDGTIKTIKYVPVALPDGVNTTQPSNTQQPTGSGDTSSQVNPQVNPNNTTDSMLQTVIDILTSPTSTPSGQTTPQTSPHSDSDTPLNPDNDNPPDTGTGSGPTVVLPSQQASALFAVYNPSLAELNSLGAWLWSSNFVDQLLKLFNDPMQAIIGLHKIFATPATGAAQNIRVGYLDSGVSSAIVTDQYTEVDCGSVNCYEYFGNVFDYDPYTKVHIFLPFIGIQQLNTADVMRSTIGVKYKVDVLTGGCIAEVSVTRDGAGGVLYVFSGDASVRYPVSSGSYMGIVSGILSVVGGVAGTIASGGALAPALMGGAVGLTHAHTDIKHGGTISGATGAMGAKKPYLIISRPQTELANNYKKYQGLPANQYNTVGNMSGYFMMRDAKVDTISGATREEKEEIKRLLETGVYT